MNHNIVFSGSLLFLSLADVFQMLAGNNCTGLLTLKSPYSPDNGLVYFTEGNPVNARWGELQGIEAVYALFGWTDGQYDFSNEEFAGLEPAIKQSMMEIILDALRMLDEGKIVTIGPESPIQGVTEEGGADGSKTDLVHPIKGPSIDYRGVAMERNYTNNAVIVKEGSHGKWLWVICEGTVRIVKETPRGPLTIARLAEGCFIGTIASLLYGEYERSATVIAEGDLQLGILDGEALHREYSLLSEPFKKILLGLNKRLKMINTLVVRGYTGNYSRALPEDEVTDDEYQNSSNLYIIREGAAHVIGKGPGGDAPLISLGPDDFFGRIPFMAFGHEPLYARVMTSSPFEAEILDSLALQKEYDALSQTFRNFIFSTATNIAMTTKLFYHFLNNNRPSPDPQ